MQKTFIIESNRQASIQQEHSSFVASKVNTPSFPYITPHRWRTYVENGIKLDQGDVLSVESSQINISGSPNDTIEFLGGLANEGDTPLADNSCALEYAYYINNIQQFNIPLPLFDMQIKVSAKHFFLNSYGAPNLGNFGLYQIATPMWNVEGVSKSTDDPPVYTLLSHAPLNNGPSIINQPNDIRLFVTAKNFSGLREYSASETPNAEEMSTILTTDKLVLNVKQGFITPSSLGNELTDQLNRRLGTADEWSVENIAPNNIGFGSFVDTANTTYKTFPTAQKQSQSDDGFGRIQYYNGVDNYEESDGEKSFWNYMLCGDVKRTLAAREFSFLRSKAIHSIEDEYNPSISTTVLVDGGTDAGPHTFQVNTGEYGAQVIIADMLDSETANVNVANKANRTYSGGPKSEENFPLLKLENGSLITTNIVVNDASIQHIASIFKNLEYVCKEGADIKEQGNQLNTDMLNSVMTADFQVGQRDDANSLFNQNRNIINLVAPQVANRWINNTFSTYELPKSYQIIGDSTPWAGKTAPETLLPNGTKIEHAKRLVNLDGVADMQIPLYTRWEDKFDPQYNPSNRFIKLPDKTQYQFTDLNGNYFNTNKLKAANNALLPHGVAVVAVFLKPFADRKSYINEFIPDDDKYRLIPYLAVISRGDINAGNGGIINDGGKRIPWPMWGEMFGTSPSLSDGMYAKIVTTQPLPGATDSLTGNQIYVPSVHAGADNCSISFDGDFGRFKITGLHTALRAGNGVFQENVEAKDASPSTSDVVASAYAKCAAVSLAKDQDITIPDSKPYLPYDLVVQSENHHFLISAQSGIALMDLYVPPLTQSTALTFNDSFIKLDPFYPLQYNGTLFDKMGFSLEQLKPYYAKSQNQFNRSNYNRFLGYNQDVYNKQNNMLYPVTTNAYIGGSLSLALSSNKNGVAMENLGVPTPNVEAKTNVVSDSLIAANLPTKLAYSYLVVHSDILEQGSTFYGSQKVTTIPAIGYITRNYESADFFFAFANDWSYTIDKPQMLNSFVVDIRLPNGRPAPLGLNSSILFKITKKGNVSLSAAS